MTAPPSPNLPGPGGKVEPTHCMYSNVLLHLFMELSAAWALPQFFMPYRISQCVIVTVLRRMFTVPSGTTQSCGIPCNNTLSVWFANRAFYSQPHKGMHGAVAHIWPCSEQVRKEVHWHLRILKCLVVKPHILQWPYTNTSKSTPVYTQTDLFLSFVFSCTNCMLPPC